MRLVFEAPEALVEGLGNMTRQQRRRTARLVGEQVLRAMSQHRPQADGDNRPLTDSDPGDENPASVV